MFKKQIKKSISTHTPLYSKKGILKSRKGQDILFTLKADEKVDLNRAGHGTEGEEGGAVFDGGLAVEGSLCVYEKHSHLQRNTWP